MKSFHAQGATIHYNSDLSGDVIIQRGALRVDVPGRMLLDLVAQYIVDERIAQLEQASTEEILGVKVPK